MILSARRGLVGFAAGVAVTGLAMPAVLVAAGVAGSEDVGPLRADTRSGSAYPIPAAQAVSVVSDWRVLAHRASSSAGGFMTRLALRLTVAA